MAVDLLMDLFFLLLFINVNRQIDVVLPPQLADRPFLDRTGVIRLCSKQCRTSVMPDEKCNCILVTLGVAIFGNILFRGFLSVIPILIAVIAGYVAAFCLGILDFSQVAAASWFALPNFQPAKFDMGAILMILPVLLVITSEHIGHQVVTGKIIGRIF